MKTRKSISTNKLTFFGQNEELNEKKSEISIEITKLREEKKNLISQLDFEGAKLIDKKIENYHKEIDISTQNSFKEEFDNNLDLIVIEHFKEIEKNEEEIKKTEKNIRIKINDLFISLQERHKNELMELEKSAMIERLSEESRKPPEYEELCFQAKNAASLGNYDEGSLLLNKANEILNIDINNRLKKLEEELKKSRQNLLNNQKNEIQ